LPFTAEKDELHDKYSIGNITKMDIRVHKGFHAE